MARNLSLSALRVRLFKLRVLLIGLCLSGLTLMPSPAAAQELEFVEKHERDVFDTDTLTGDWNGFRTRLLEHGVFLELEYFGEAFHLSPKGRDASNRYFGIVDMEMHINTERLFNGPEGHIFAFATWMHGSRFQPFISSTHDLSSIEARDNLVLMQFWYDLHFFEERLSVLFGLYDIANEFDFRHSAQLFVNGAFGTGVDLTESGDKGVPTYPLTALGVRFKLQMDPNFYFLTAFMDGVPNDPNEKPGTRVVLDADDEGFLSINEIGYQSVRPKWGLNKIGLGAWLFTRRYPDLVLLDSAGNPVKHTGTQGVYAFAEGTLYQEAEESRQGLELFARVGFTDKDVNSIATYLDGGLVYTGLVPGRNADELGIAFSTLFFSDKFEQQQKTRGLVIDDPETLIELTYKAFVMPGFYLQPDFQYVFNPVPRGGVGGGITDSPTDHLAVGLRFGINL